MILEQLKLGADATEEQAAAAVAALQDELKQARALRNRGHSLTPEKEASVARRRAAGLTLDDAIVAELAQAAHDAALSSAATGKKGKGVAALIALLFGLLCCLLPTKAKADAKRNHGAAIHQQLRGELNEHVWRGRGQ